MKIIKDFLKKIDVFGITFNFKYKSKENIQLILEEYLFFYFQY